MEEKSLPKSFVSHEAFSEEVFAPRQTETNGIGRLLNWKLQL